MRLARMSFTALRSRSHRSLASRGNHLVIERVGPVPLAQSLRGNRVLRRHRNGSCPFPPTRRVGHDPGLVRIGEFHRALRVQAAEEIEFVRLCRLGAHHLVEQDGVVVPTVPVAEHGFHELVRAVVAEVVFQVLRTAEISGLGVVERGDYVPRRAAARRSCRRC